MNADDPSTQDPARLTEFVTQIVNTAIERFRQDQLLQRPESSNAGRERNLDGGMRGNSQFSRVTKIELPKFRGEDFVRFMVEDVDWNAYRTAILKRFDVAYDDPLGELKKLKQTTHVQDEIELPVRMFKPRTLAEVYGLCKLEEAKVNAVSGQVYLLEVLGDTNTELLDVELEEEVLEIEEIIEYSPHISLNAINDLNTTKKLGCQLTSTCPLKVEVVGGHQLTSNYMCKVLGGNYMGRNSELMPCLPPIRSCDHQIPLKEVTIPINSRPYRYPPTQKDAIEVMVRKLLDTGVIRDSQSLFSSPVVMVKKRWYLENVHRL
ncbi:hypothetical protein Tco_0646431 [Tanacetum coccineum]